VLIAGCSHEAPPPKFVAPPAPAPVVVVAIPAPAPPPPALTIHITEDLRTACAIQDADTDRTTLFHFDSSELSSGDQRLLTQLARCLTSGPLGGRVLTLVGRADPRGTEEYNMALGDRRTGSVQSFLRGQGMDGDKLQASSRGALDAQGTDEAGWIKDRRVDVALAAL
jgi:outer membrane protein OmpA-like peptidoglycan-associated protein